MVDCPNLRARLILLGRLCLPVLLLMLGHSAGARASAQSPPDLDALAVYDQSDRPALDYEATVAVRLPLGTGSFDIVSVGGVTYVRPTAGPGNPASPAAVAFAPETDPLSAVELLRQNYTLDLKAGPTFLGRETWEITLTPRWQGSPVRRVLVDRATHVRMVVEDRDHAGRILQRREVVALRLTPGRRSAKVIQRAGKRKPWLSLEQANVTIGPWLRLPGYLPPGYRLVGVRPAAKPGGFVHLAFFDGLGLISLYEREVPWWARPALRAGTERAGVSWTRNGVRFYLVGDVPPEELQRIAASVK